MENDFTDGGHDPEAQPTAQQARDARALLNADGARLAARMRTPWWYHPVVAFFAAVFVVSPVAPGGASTIVLALGVIGLTVFTLAYAQRAGGSIERPAGRASRRLLFVSVAVVILGMLVTVFISVSDVTQWWAVLPTVVAFCATVVLGRAYEHALRAELARNGDPAA